MSSLNSTHTCRNNSLEEEPDYEDPIEIKVLRKQRGDFMHGIIPSQIVPHLTCLTRADESCILAATSRKGDIEGAGVLLYHLMTKKDVWYEDLLKALRNNDVKLEHLATSLENEVKKRKEEVYDIEMTCEDSYSESYDTGNLESPPSQNCNQVYACHIITESGTKPGIKTELHVPGVPDYPPPPYSKVEHGYDQALSVDNEGCHGDVIKQDGGNIQSKRVYESEETAKESLEKEVISPAAESTPVGTSESQTRHVINYEVLKPRGYQEELAGPACKGLNSIICAPTGTGKTHVAMMVSKNHMHRAMEVQAAGNSSTNAQTFVTVQNPDNKVELEKYVSIPDKFTTIAATRSPDPFQDRIAETMAEIEHKTGDIESEETAKESLEKEVISPAAESTPVGTSESQTRHVINYEVLKPRGYQEELAGPAYKGLNSIICAPVGTGKTHVAMMVSKNHMHRAMEVQAAGNSSTSKGKILLIVHMNRLLNQTYKRFKTYLPLFKTGKISGVTTSKLTFEHLAKINDIVITTAGFFENILEKKTTSISAFSLIIIDECHYAMKNHSYNRIMTEYLKIKLAGCSAQLPQIVGLTACPGTGGKSQLQAAQTHLLKLCANLDAQTFVTVQNPDNKIELEKYVSKPDKFTTIAATRSPDPFQDRIAEIMAEIEHKTGDIETCPQRGTEEYEQFIITTRNETLNGNKHETVQCCEHLIQYNKALQISSMCRMSDGLKIIDGFYNERWQRGQHETTSIEKYLYKLFRRNSSELFDISEDENKYPNPKVLKLKENLAEEIKKMDEELRGIIFVKTRALARAIYECIVDDKTLKSLKPAILVGVKSTGVECMTQAEQDTRLRKFALGHCKLLVATSVAEEGLDIKECHMLIRYNYSTNVISLRQSSGRARALESTEHFIGDEDLATRDSVNVFLDQQMEKAIDLIQDMPQAQLQGTVRHTQMNDIAEVYEKESKHIPVKFKSNSVKLYCTGCGKYVCNGNDVYIYDESSHIIVDKAIIKNIATIMTTRSVMLG
uniref:RNA helicase n=1 Tax=Saccoglossus kowalevskii TaxID=10224 RepID=A0ABM0GUY3_SACKO|nr:PREDICTED: interferon-induced helicase C domain-containing protein 1-like [Saccoglossus kowalevskii]